MVNELEEKVPGVTFHFQHSSFQKPQADEKFRVTLTLDCAVNDAELWRVVEEKFKAGFRVFTSEDFHIEVIDVMRQKLTELESQLLVRSRELAQARDTAAQAQAELQKYKGPLETFGQALRGNR